MNELYHHGTLGMRWGVRRFQNKNGSLTPAGKKRRKETKKNESLSDDDKKKIIEKGDVKKANLNKTQFTNKELDDIINRKRKFNDLNDLASKDNGKSFIDKAVDTTKKVSQIAESGYKIYSNIDKIGKLINGEPVDNNNNKNNNDNNNSNKKKKNSNDKSKQ